MKIRKERILKINTFSLSKVLLVCRRWCQQFAFLWESTTLTCVAVITCLLSLACLEFELNKHKTCINLLEIDTIFTMSMVTVIYLMNK
jgi:hypothetical protein